MKGRGRDRRIHSLTPEEAPGLVSADKLQALLSEGLNVYWGKTLVNTVYLEDGKGEKAIFEDGTEVTGSILIGADGPRSIVRCLLIGPDRAKPTPIDLATTHCLTSYS